MAGSKAVRKRVPINRGGLTRGNRNTEWSAEQDVHAYCSNCLVGANPSRKCAERTRLTVHTLSCTRDMNEGEDKEGERK